MAEADADSPKNLPSSTDSLEQYNLRREKVLATLENVRSRVDVEQNKSLVETWVDELRDGLDLAVSRSHKWGKQEAMVMQFADAALHYEPDAEFATTFLDAFGAHATLRNGRVIKADAESVSEIVQDYSLPHVILTYQGRDKTEQIPLGSLLLISRPSRIPSLVLETNIEGVRLIMDGSAISSPESDFRQLRPMLLIHIGNAPVPVIPEEDPEAKKRTWKEIHGRDPRVRREEKDYGRRLSDRELLDPKGDVDLALAFQTWLPVPKSGEEITVTPSELKPDPFLETEDKRLETVDTALAEARRHAYYAERGLTRGVVGNMAHGFAIMAEVLQMTPEEIVKDTEALTDLTEYLRQVARGKEGYYGPSALMPPEEGNELEELAAHIDDTWILLDEHGVPYMYQRINSVKRSPNDSTN